MSREIKFRVWFRNDQTGNQYCQYYVLPDWFVYESLQDISVLRIDQFTGLHDKNGVEIYEGDILLYERVNGEKEPTIIEYVDDMFHCKSTKYKNLSRGNYRLATLHCNNEVIGNIHEQAEHDE